MSSPSKRMQATIKKEAMSPGRIIAGKYRYLRSLGEGGMGQVYLVCDVENNQKLAVKSCFADHESRFEREVHSWIRLGRHPNVVAAIYFDRVDGIPSLFIEYVDGGTLSEAIRKSREEKKDIPTEIVFDYAIQICRGMAHLHKNGIIHRDLKPSNILIATENNGPGILKITDMGLSKFKGWGDLTPDTLVANEQTSIISNDPELTHTKDMLGTPQYMSPQQYESSKEVGEETDIYSFGLITYEMLTQGKKPFDAGEDYRGWLYLHTYEMPKHIKNHVTGRFSFFQRKSRNALSDLVMQCLAKKKEERPCSFLEIENQLKELYSQLFSRKYDMERQLEITTMTSEEMNNQAVSLLEMAGPYAEEGSRKLTKLCVSSRDCTPALLNRCLYQLKSQQITLREFWRLTKDLPYKNPQERSKIVQIMLGAALERGSFLAQSLDLLADTQTPAWSSGLLRLHAKWRYSMGDYSKATKLFQTLCRGAFAIAEDFYHCAGAMTEQALRENRGHVIVEKNHYSLILSEEAKAPIRKVLLDAIQKCGDYIWLQEGQNCLAGKPTEKTYCWHEYSILRGHAGKVLTVEISADQNYALSIGIDDSIRFWDISQQQEIGSHTQKGIVACSLDPQGELALVASQHGQIKLWNLIKKKVCWQSKYNTGISSVAFSGNGQICGFGTDSGKIILYEVEKLLQPSFLGLFPSKVKHEFLYNNFPITSLRLSLDGQYALAISKNTVVLWDTKGDSRTLGTYDNTEKIYIAISHDSKLAIVATSQAQNNIMLWDIATGNKLLAFTGVSQSIEAMTIASNGRLIFIAHQGTITIWDMLHREKIAFLEGHTDSITHLSVTLDASMLVSSGVDGTIRVWKNRYIWPLICIQSYWKATPEVEDENNFVQFDDD